MVSVILNLLPLMLGSALFPLWLISNLILLMGDNGNTRSAALISGGIFARALQGILFGVVFVAMPVISINGRESPITSTLLLVTGIVFLTNALIIYLSGSDPDDPPPRWMKLVDGLSPRKLFLLGIAGVVIGIRPWIFTLSALSVIKDAQMPWTENLIAYSIYVVGCMTLLLIPLLLGIFAPGKSKPTFLKMRRWLETHSHLITMFVSAVFGAFFLFKGIVGLLANV